jgi:hypothetical protein
LTVPCVCLYLREPEIHVQTAPQLREHGERVGNLLLLIRLAKEGIPDKGEVRGQEMNGYSSLGSLGIARARRSRSLSLSAHHRFAAGFFGSTTHLHGCVCVWRVRLDEVVGNELQELREVDERLVRMDPDLPLQQQHIA